MRKSQIAGLIGIVLSPSAWSQGILELPHDGAMVSGIGIISGWECSADQIAIEIDGSGLLNNAPSGGDRFDTEPVCGDADNGFASAVNWNVLGDGAHTVTVYADGVEFDSASVIVTTFDAPYLTEAGGAFSLRNFPETGSETVIEWDQSIQNFVVVDYVPSRIPVELPDPPNKP